MSTSGKKSFGKIFKKYWWIALILLLVIAGGVYVALNGFPWADKTTDEVVDSTPASTDPFDLDLTKDLSFNLDIIERYLGEDEWALSRLSVYKDYLDMHVDELTEQQMPIYYRLAANHAFRYRLNNGQWNQPIGEALSDLQYDTNLYERSELLADMADYHSESRFADFYAQYQADLPDMYFSAISSAWNNSDTVVDEPEPAPVVDPTPRVPRKPKEKEVVETPSQKLLKALRNYSPQTPEATIREQVYLDRYPNYKADLQRLSKAVQNERNTNANHRASHYEECLKGAEDFEDLLIRYGI